MASVLFVCLGNICRSPLAEGVFRHQVAAAGLGEAFTIDSAGTGGWHEGELPDPRARAVARKYGVALESRARQVTRADFTRFERVLAMDAQNLRDLLRVCPPGEAARVALFRRWDPEGEGDVPDPYYGGDEGFEQVFRMVDRTCRALLEDLRA